MRVVTVETYQPGVIEDAALLGWWLELGQTGDLERCFGRPAAALTEFVRMLARSQLWFFRDERGWAGVIWADPLLAGASVGLWIRADRRQSQASLAFARAVFVELLQRYPVLVMATRSEAVVRDAVALGFTFLGQVPYLFDGDACAICFVTPFAYQAAEQGVH